MSAEAVEVPIPSPPLAPSACAASAGDDAIKCSVSVFS